MNNKIGRPTIPKKEAKSVLLGAQLSPLEAKQAEKAAAASGLDKSKWLRRTIENEVNSPPVWIKSKWKAGELHGHAIEFRLRSPESELSGVGILRVVENARGEVAVDIFIDEPDPSGGIACTRIWLAKDAVDRIEWIASPQPGKFRLVG